MGVAEANRVERQDDAASELVRKGFVIVVEGILRVNFLAPMRVMMMMVLSLRLQRSEVFKARVFSSPFHRRRR